MQATQNKLRLTGPAEAVAMFCSQKAYIYIYIYTYDYGVCIYIYIHTYVSLSLYIYIYIYIKLTASTEAAAMFCSQKAIQRTISSAGSLAMTVTTTIMVMTIILGVMIVIV